MSNESKSMSTKDLSEAIDHLLEREEARERRRQLRRRREVRRRRDQLDETVGRLARSIEVIKWCIVSITTVMAVALLILILVVMQVQREAEHIKGEVERIQREAELIRDKIRHPLETLGGTFGRRLDREVGEMLGMPEEE